MKEVDVAAVELLSHHKRDSDASQLASFHISVQQQLHSLQNASSIILPTSVFASSQSRALFLLFYPEVYGDIVASYCEWRGTSESLNIPNNLQILANVLGRCYS